MTSRPQPRSGNEAGFTLIEVLIAMTLMVAILAALATVTAQWLPNWNRGFAHVQRTELFGRGLERLVADLAAAEFVTVNGKSKLPMFDGSELSVLFVRSAIGPNTRPGLEYVRLATVSDERGTALVRTRAPFVPIPPGGQIGDLATFRDPVVIMRLPYRATFAYAGPDQVWQNSWQDKDQLPLAVRVSVRDAATSRTLAMSTATPVHIGAPAECARVKNPKECVFPPANAPGEPK